jgi:hypothetical protein
MLHIPFDFTAHQSDSVITRTAGHQAPRTAPGELLTGALAGGAASVLLQAGDQHHDQIK